VQWLAVCIAVLAWAPSGVAIGDLWRRRDCSYAEFLFWLIVLLVPLVGPAAYRVMLVSPSRGGGTLVVVTGIMAVWTVLLPLLGVLSSVAWRRVPTTRAEVDYWMGFSAEYEYTLDGRKHRGERYGFIEPDEYLTKEEVEPLTLKRYSVCYVAPWSDDTAVLVRELPPRAFAWRSLWVIACVGFYRLRRRRISSSRSG
jgi:hypothetical protein